MSVRMFKPWLPLNKNSIKSIASHLGVFELANGRDKIVYIGVAGGRSLFGLKGELVRLIDSPPADANQFRVEVNMAYHTRYIELLQAFYYDNGVLPIGNSDLDIRMLGRLRLAG